MLRKEGAAKFDKISESNAFLQLSESRKDMLEFAIRGMKNHSLREMKQALSS
jgi:hypothetical protein